MTQQLSQERIIITGGLGYIGSQLVHDLLKKPSTQHITIIDNNYKNSYHSEEIKFSLLDERVKVVPLDLTQSSNLPTLKQFFYNVDTVYHCAAIIGGVRLFHDRAFEILRDNHRMTENVVECLNEYQRFIYISSSMVFEASQEYPHTEESLARTPIPFSAYGFSKLSGEYYTRFAAQKKGFKWNIVRPFNCLCTERPEKEFGNAHVTIDLTTKIWQGQGTSENRLEIIGDGTQLRHYTAIEDISDAIITIADSDKYNKDYNIASNEGVMVKELAYKIWKIMKPDARWSAYPHPYFKSLPGLPHDVQKRVPSTAKIKEHLGWEAKYTLDQKLPEVVKSVVKILEQQNG